MPAPCPQPLSSLRHQALSRFPLPGGFGVSLPHIHSLAITCILCMWNSWDAHLFTQLSSWIRPYTCPSRPVPSAGDPHAPGVPPPVPLHMLVPQQPALSSQAVHASKPGQGQLASPWGHTCHPPLKHATFSVLSPCLGFPSPAPPCESLHSSAPQEGRAWSPGLGPDPETHTTLSVPNQTQLSPFLGAKSLPGVSYCSQTAPHTPAQHLGALSGAALGSGGTGSSRQLARLRATVTGPGYGARPPGLPRPGRLCLQGSLCSQGLQLEEPLGSSSAGENEACGKHWLCHPARGGTQTREARGCHLPPPSGRMAWQQDCPPGRQGGRLWPLGRQGLESGSALF